MAKSSLVTHGKNLVKEPNNGVREKELSRSPGCGAGVFHSYRYSSLSQDIVRTSPPARGSKVPVNVYALSTPYLCPILGVHVHRLNQVLAVIQSSFRPNSMDVEAALHLRISSFRK